MIPSTYVFLSLYSLINLNVINWGTREAADKATGQVSIKESLAEKLLRRVANLQDENSVLTGFLMRAREKDDSYEKIRVLERKCEQTEKILRNLQVQFLKCLITFFSNHQTVKKNLKTSLY